MPWADGPFWPGQSSREDGDNRLSTLRRTLREALNASNGLPTTENISFDITSGSSTVKTTFPRSLLPTITDDIAIDGCTQPVAEPNDAMTNANSAVLKV